MSRTDMWQETFNARSEYSNSEDDGTAQHRINQYLVKQEIGRGSFGAVHLAEDQYGQEYVRTPAYYKFRWAQPGSNAVF
jgi:[calcium/calmodulin-dependent protein kinase] kinase